MGSHRDPKVGESAAEDGRTVMKGKDWSEAARMVQRLVGGAFEIVAEALNSADYAPEIRRAVMVQTATEIDAILGQMRANQRMFPETKDIYLPLEPVSGVRGKEPMVRQ